MCEAAISSARSMPLGVSIIAHTAIDAGRAGRIEQRHDRAPTSAALSTLGTRIASAPDVAIAATSALPHGVPSPLQRMAISRLP